MVSPVLFPGASQATVRLELDDFVTLTLVGDGKPVIIMHEREKISL